MIIFLSLLVALIGVGVYLVAANPKLVEVGWVMFATGLLAFLIKVGPSAFELISK